ncbi:MAG: COX15/CtaA family protein [Myxococcales bacterium]|nr:COX15/CtaA family protein [Myxococcales bacterium]
MPVSTIRRLAFALTLCTWGLLVFGASVRVHGAGLACPDWPLCFGQVVPPLDFQVGLEFGHRVVAGLISLGFLALGALLWRSREAVARPARRWWGLAAVLLIVQIVLGGLTVLELLAEWTVTSHLLTGNAFCLTLLLLTLCLAEERAPRRLALGVVPRAGAIVLAGLVLAQLTLGGLVASSHAGLVCGTFPSCNGGAWFPSFSGELGLQVGHRLVAWLLLGAALLQVATTRGRGSVGRASLVLLGVVVAQAAVGISNVLLRLPVEVTLLHSFGAAGTVLCTGWLNNEVWRSAVREPTTTPSVGATALAGEHV